MWHKSPQHLFVALCLALAGCATTDLETRSVGQVPEDKSSYQASIWEAFALHEKRIKVSGARVNDPALTEYVETLVCELAAEHCEDIRVYIIEDASFNALMAPNGMMLLHTGTLLRAETEAELAFVLGHEIGHFVEQHSFERYGLAKNSIQASAFLTASFGNLFAAGATAAFSREQELSADRFGVQALSKAGYDPTAAYRLWSNVTLEILASSNKRKRRTYERSTYLSSHPSPLDRLEYLKTEQVEKPANETLRTEYRSIIRPLLTKWLANDVTQRDFATSLHLINRLSSLGTDLGCLEYARGEVYRLRNEDGDAPMALASYERAIQHEDAPSLAWRQMGDQYMRQGDHSAANSAFETYLALTPDAKDRLLIESIMQGFEETAL